MKGQEERTWILDTEAGRSRQEEGEVDKEVGKRRREAGECGSGRGQGNWAGEGGSRRGRERLVCGIGGRQGGGVERWEGNVYPYFKI